MPSDIITDHKLQCYHCGEICADSGIRLAEKLFCCEGCKMVYLILSSNELCEYYNLNEKPGITQKVKVRKDKFAFLEDVAVQNSLISFKEGSQVHVTFYLPQIHCSSCLFLLENLHKPEPAVLSSKVNFIRKEVTIIFDAGQADLRKVAELLASIGYEPYICLNDLEKKHVAVDKSMIYQLGVAGFCFGNIMLMSFPEYLGIDAGEAELRAAFRWINFGLALPVLLYSALPFYQSSWNSIKHKFLNIDAPIALAIIITFIRSAYEVITGAGGGYFDSMTGIVFFMLAGRFLQNKTYRQLSFERDYTSYFPVAVSVLKDNSEIPTPLPGIKAGNTLLIHHQELIPADGILTKGRAFIDYSFVTGESMPVLKETGELLYAGGRQTEGNIELLVIKEVSQSYLTGLWNKSEFKSEKHTRPSFVNLLSRYFTYIVFAIAMVTAVYWQFYDQSKIWPAVTAVFIIACPCALLLANTFTNGNILRVLGRNHFYLRNAQIIEEIAGITHIIFDKTGTLTSPHQQDVKYEGKRLTDLQKQQVTALANCSNHPLSKILAKHFQCPEKSIVSGYKEITGEGITGFVENNLVKIGSHKFITGDIDTGPVTSVYISIDHIIYGRFCFSNHYRNAIPALLRELSINYNLSILSGDNEAEKINLRKLAGEKAVLLFNQAPEDKLLYIQKLQSKGAKVMMIGDGLNDAGALKQSNTGVALSENNNNFTPASDAVMDAEKLPDLAKFIRLCKANRYIVLTGFCFSVLYNVVGLFFAVQGNLSPMIAAILMPSSSLCIILLTFGCSNRLAARMKGPSLPVSP